MCGPVSISDVAHLNCVKRKVGRQVGQETGDLLFKIIAKRLSPRVWGRAILWRPVWWFLLWVTGSEKRWFSNTRLPCSYNVYLSLLMRWNIFFLSLYAKACANHCLFDFIMKHIRLTSPLVMTQEQFLSGTPKSSAVTLLKNTPSPWQLGNTAFLYWLTRRDLNLCQQPQPT